MPELPTWPFTWYLFGMVACGFVDAVVGRAKDAELAVFVLGLLFGPRGLILAFAFDFRPPDERVSSPMAIDFCRNPIAGRECAEPLSAAD